jgi:hypothetical protein
VRRSIRFPSRTPAPDLEPHAEHVGDSEFCSVRCGRDMARVIPSIVLGISNVHLQSARKRDA